VHSQDLAHRENAVALIWVQNVLENRNTFWKSKMLQCSNQVELGVSTLCNSVLIKKLLNKLNLTYFFSPFCSNIKNIDT